MGQSVKTCRQMLPSFNVYVGMQPLQTTFFTGFIQILDHAYERLGYLLIGLLVRFREREVSLLIQVPGCVLEIPGAGPAKGFFSQGQVAKHVPLTSTLNGVRKCREMSEIPPANADILEFPGYVDSKGVLRLYNWTSPRSEMQHDTATAFKEAGGGKDKVTGQLASDASETDPVWRDLAELPLSLMNAWVLRESEPVFLLPQVQHAYVYLVPVGEEHLPPKIFGRIPLTLSVGTKAALDSHGSAGDPSDWPPSEALSNDKVDSVSELEQTIPSSETEAFRLIA